MPTVIIPMAGKGSRFSNAGYSLPKPLVKVAGKTLAEISIKTLGLPDWHFVFITRSFENSEHNEMLTEIFTKNCKSFTEVRIDDEHLGAAHSALYAEKYLQLDDELIITNCDQALKWDPELFLREVRHQGAYGAVVVYTSNDPNHSYAQIKENRIVKLAEKEVISDTALIGVHYWKKAKDFFDTARKLLAEYKDLGYKEPYVSLTYNYLLINKPVVPYIFHGSERYYSLGTPSDIDNYLNMGEKVRLHFDEIRHTAEVGDVVSVSGTIPYSILKDVEIKLPSRGDEEKYLENVFLFNANEKSFYHGLCDVVGQWLALKKLTQTDISPLYLEINSDISFNNIQPFMKELLDLGIVNLLTVDDTIGRVKIKNLFVISPRDYSLFYKLFMDYIPQILTEESHPGNPEYIKLLLGSSSKEILDNLSVRDNTQKNNKVFFHASNNKVGTGSLDIDETHNRFASKDEYEAVVKLFTDDGYEVIDPERLSVADQINIVRKASHIATIKGSNSVHSAFASSDTVFTMINLKKENTFPHEVIVSSFIENPIFIDKTGSNENL